VYPDTCDHATLASYFRQGDTGAVFAVSPTEMWMTGRDGYLLHGVMDDRPRVELIPLPTFTTMTTVWGSGPNDVWVAGDTPDETGTAPGGLQPLAFHWDGCHWTRSLGPPGFPVGWLAGGEAGRPWMASSDQLLQWSGTAWIARDNRVEHGVIGMVFAAPAGALFGASVDYNVQRVATIYQWVDGHWLRLSSTVSASNLQMAFGRDWAAMGNQRSNGLPANAWIYRLDRAPEEVRLGDMSRLISVGGVLGLVTYNGASFYDNGQWRSDALSTALALREMPLLVGARMHTYDNSPTRIEGVHWYILPTPRSSTESGLVGCSARSGQVRCIGALEAEIDLNQAP